MSRRDHEVSRAVRFSALVYNRLLVLYPQAFRREYGAHMAQVFRDCCREALHTNGITGLWRYWAIALGDRVVSAIAERRQEELSMSHNLDSARQLSSHRWRCHHYALTENGPESPRRSSGG